LRLGLTATLTAVALFASTECSQRQVQHLNRLPNRLFQPLRQRRRSRLRRPHLRPNLSPRRRSTPPQRPYPRRWSHRSPRPPPCLPLRPSPCLRQHSRLQLRPFPCLRRHPCPPPHPFTSRFRPSFPRLLLREYLWKQAQDPHQPNPAALLSPRNFHSPSNQLNLIPGVMPFSPCKGLTRGKG